MKAVRRVRVEVSCHASLVAAKKARYTGQQCLDNYREIIQSKICCGLSQTEAEIPKNCGGARWATDVESRERFWELEGACDVGYQWKEFSRV